NLFASDVGPWIAFDDGEGGPFDVIPRDDTTILVFPIRHEKEVAETRRSDSNEWLEEYPPGDGTLERDRISEEPRDLAFGVRLDVNEPLHAGRNDVLGAVVARERGAVQRCPA